MTGRTFNEIEAGFVASGQNMGDAGACDADRVGELGLTDVFRGEKLLKTLVHKSKRIIHKSNKSVTFLQELQMEIVDELCIACS